MGQPGSILYVRDTGTCAGRGVFTRQKISAGTLIESCPIILLDESELSPIQATRLDEYYYLWSVDQKDAALPLGYGLLYNHSDTPNAYYQRDLDNGIMNYIAIAEISPGEEITVNYNGNPADQTPFQFR